MIRTVVIGYGFAGKCFHSYLIKLADGLQLWGISSRNAETRERIVQEQGVKAYSSLDEVVADPEVNLVVLATPHNVHAQQAIQAMDAGKHVVTDKAMCMTAAEADAMLEARDRNNVMLSVFHNRRWDWGYNTIKQIIQEGWIGEPYLYEAAVMRYGRPGGWRAVKAQSGGILYDWGAHLLDQGMLLLGGDVESVSCEIRHLKWDIDIGNYGRLLLKSSKGTIYQMEIGNVALAPKPRWYVVGDLGGIIKYGIDPQEPPMIQGDIDAATESPKHRAAVYTIRDGERKRLIIDSVQTSWKSYYQNISDVLNKGAELAVKPEEARNAMAVLDAALESAETGQTVKPDLRSF